MQTKEELLASKNQKAEQSSDEEDLEVGLTNNIKQKEKISVAESEPDQNFANFKK